MKFKFKKITRALLLIGLLSSNSLVHNGVDAMELPQGMDLLSFADHKALVDNMINNGEMAKAVYVGTCYYVGNKIVGDVRDLDLACLYLEATALQNSDISKLLLNKIQKEKENIYRIDFSDEWIKEVVIDSVLGDIIMQTILATTYYNGDGLPKDYESALFWAIKASSTELSEAFENEQKQDEYQAKVQSQFLIATIYARGNGVDCDPEMASKYYKLVGENPYASGHMLHELGIYLYGKGIKIDVDLGMKYLRAAKDKGHKSALAETISFNRIKKFLIPICREKSKNNTVSLLRSGNFFYEKFNSSFNELKDIKNEDITEKEMISISLCVSSLIYSVECENALGKIMKEAITKRNDYPRINDKIFNILKMYIPEYILIFEELKEIIKHEERAEFPFGIILATDNAIQMPTMSVVKSNKGTKNNALSVDKGKNNNVNNTTSRSRINNHENKNFLDLSGNSTESLKNKITQKKVELNKKNATKKSAKKNLTQSKQELRQSEQKLSESKIHTNQSKQALDEISVKYSKLKKEQAVLKKEIEIIEDAERRSLADMSYEDEISYVTKESESKEPAPTKYSFSVSKINHFPKNSDPSEAKNENKTERNFLENLPSIQTKNLEMMEKKEIKNQPNLSSDIPEKKQSITKTLKTKVKKWNDNREEKSESKHSKTNSNSPPVKIGNTADTKSDKSSLVTNSVSQTIEESSFSVTENESQFSKTEASDNEKFMSIDAIIICDEMKKSYPKLFRILNKRDVSCLNLIKFKSSTIIYDTIRNMCQQDKICGSWDGKNIHVQKKKYQNIVFNAHTTHGSSGYIKWYYNPEIVVDFITFVADCDDLIKDFCIWKFGENCFSRLSNDSAETANTSKPE